MLSRVVSIKLVLSARMPDLLVSDAVVFLEKAGIAHPSLTKNDRKKKPVLQDLAVYHT